MISDYKYVPLRGELCSEESLQESDELQAWPFTPGSLCAHSGRLLHFPNHPNCLSALWRVTHYGKVLGRHKLKGLRNTLLILPLLQGSTGPSCGWKQTSHYDMRLSIQAHFIGISGREAHNAAAFTETRKCDYIELILASLVPSSYQQTIRHHYVSSYLSDFILFSVLRIQCVSVPRGYRKSADCKVSL